MRTALVCKSSVFTMALKTLLGILLVVTITSAFPEPEANVFFPLVRDTFYYEGHKYTFHRERLTWEEASKVCRSEGGYLAVLEDALETDFVVDAMAGGLCNFYSFQNIWIGGKFVNGKWIWVPTGLEIPRKIGADGYPPWANNVREDNMCLIISRVFMNRPRFSDLNCARKRNFLCEHGCAQLKDNDRGHWEPPLCSQTFSEIGDLCSLVCNEGYETFGPDDVICTSEGWNGTGGLNSLPSCKSPDEGGIDIIDNINRTVGVPANILFLIDESVSITPEQFDMEKEFVSNIIKSFPLSANRTAGLITFSHVADVDLSMTYTDTCKFVDELKNVVYTKGGTSIAVAMDLALQEIKRNAVHDLTLVFLITDGISTTDPSPQANEMKQNGNVVFTIGIADFQEDQLLPLASVSENGVPDFFGISSFEVFNKLSQYLKDNYIDSSQFDC